MVTTGTTLRVVCLGAACSALALLAACGESPTNPEEPGGGGSVLTGGVSLYTYRVVEAYPHDPGAFTQGLVLDDGVLFEGTGLRGHSSLRRVDLATGTVLQRHDLNPDLFGEGITVFGDRVVQLTWTSGTGFVYDRETFAREGTFSYATEGWGLTQDGERLIMSDGTPTLRFLDPESLGEIGRVDVRDGAQPVQDLNELEYIEGHVFANVWRTDRIAVIDPAGGQVVAWIDLEGLLPADEGAGADVLNGIAFDADAGRLLVTGKLWPRLFAIELVPEE